MQIGEGIENQLMTIGLGKNKIQRHKFEKTTFPCFFP
jgi:hypothetical protein